MSQSQHDSPYAVDSLRPETQHGSAGKVFQLNANTVSLVRITGRDEIGRPIEETIPHNKGMAWVHPHGHINNVPMRTAPTGWQEPGSARYEEWLRLDLIRSGWIPLSSCPYSFEASYATGAAYVKVPDGQKACPGHSEGCAHLKTVIAGRLAASKAQYDADQTRVQMMRSEDVERMMEAVGTAIAKATDPKAARSRLARGQGEEG